MPKREEIELEAYFISQRKPHQSKEDNWKEAEFHIEARAELAKIMGWGATDL